MPVWQRRYLVACAGMIGFALAYSMSAFFRWPRLTYFPIERRWEVVSGAGEMTGSGYLGLVLWGLGGFLVVAAATGLVARRIRRPLATRWLGLAGAWALTGFILAGLYFTWREWPF